MAALCCKTRTARVFGVIGYFSAKLQNTGPATIIRYKLTNLDLPALHGPELYSFSHFCFE